MNIANYCGCLENTFEWIGLIEKEIDINEADERINQEANRWLQLQKAEIFDIRSNSMQNINNMRMKMWNQFSQIPTPTNPLLHKAFIKFYQGKNSDPSLAIHLGCGNDMSIIELLQNGWNVIAIDNCSAVLNKLKELVNRHNPLWISKEKVSFVCEDIESYQFPKNVRLILALNSLSYCNPTKIKGIWDNAYNSLETNGLIVGNFYPHLNDPNKENIRSAIDGCWFTDIYVIKALLKDKGYEQVICEYNQFSWNESGRRIEFIGKKV